jgi:hypothetical protein
VDLTRAAQVKVPLDLAVAPYGGLDVWLDIPAAGKQDTISMSTTAPDPINAVGTVWVETSGGSRVAEGLIIRPTVYHLTATSKPDGMASPHGRDRRLFVSLPPFVPGAKVNYQLGLEVVQPVADPGYSKVPLIVRNHQWENVALGVVWFRWFLALALILLGGGMILLVLMISVPSALRRLAVGNKGPQ